MTSSRTTFGRPFGRRVTGSPHANGNEGAQNERSSTRATGARVWIWFASALPDSRRRILPEPRGRRYEYPYPFVGGSQQPRSTQFDPYSSVASLPTPSNREVETRGPVEAKDP